MLSGWQRVWRIVTGPNLYRVHYDQSPPYVATSCEAAASWALDMAATVVTMGKVCSPIVMLMLYRRDFFTSPEPGMRAVMYIVLFYVTCMTVRSVGRLQNVVYKQFIDDIYAYERSPTSEHLQKLRTYDYDTGSWPIEYQWSAERTPKQHHLRPMTDYAVPNNELLAQVHTFGSYILANTIGISMMFPGTFFSAHNPALVDGRRQLIEEQGGVRSCVRSRTNDIIDTIFIDRRNKHTNLAPNTLLVTCEGNCGFYEVGVAKFVSDTDYSLLGWNTPGFAGSTGTPWPHRIAAGIDAVMQYAEHRLNYAPENVVIVAWSIGGFAATWSAMQNARRLGGVVLDATFDDVPPLAHTILPSWASNLITTTIRRHLDLPNARQLVFYDGPVLLIRRTRDEIITTRPHGDENERLRHNRANVLLHVLLRHRYPQLFECDNAESHLDEYLHLENDMQRAVMLSTLNTTTLKHLLRMAVDKRADAAGPLFPMQLPESALLTDAARLQMLLYLASHYMLDVNIGHNDKMPHYLLRLPKHPWADEGVANE